MENNDYIRWRNAARRPNVRRPNVTYRPSIYSLGRRASSCSRAQYTYRDDAHRHDSSQGVKPAGWPRLLTDCTFNWLETSWPLFLQEKGYLVSS